MSDRQGGSGRVVAPGSVWKSHKGYTCCVLYLGLAVPSTEPAVAVQVLYDGTGNVFFFEIAYFLGEAATGVSRFTRIEE